MLLKLTLLRKNFGIYQYIEACVVSECIVCFRLTIYIKDCKQREYPFANIANPNLQITIKIFPPEKSKTGKGVRFKFNVYEKNNRGSLFRIYCIRNKNLHCYIKLKTLYCCTLLFIFWTHFYY